MHAPALPELLAVVPAGALALGGAIVPIAGSWLRHGGAALFTPRFRPVAGVVYVIVGRSDARQAWSELARVDVPGEQLVPSTGIARIDPDVSEVPANLLRFSVTFSAPMQQGSAEGRIRLLDADGTGLPDTLLGMPPELWDRNRRRLTVLLEPGRIKRGLQPNVQAGPPLEEGSTVTFDVGRGLRDDTGAELVTGARRTYRVGAPVRVRVDPARWEVRWPAAGSGAERLVVRFDRPLDRALIRRCLVAIDGDGHPVPGSSALDDDARQWTFVPAPGREGDAAPRSALAALRIDTRLEDLAGNSVRRVFDRQLGLDRDEPLDDTAITVHLDGRLTGS